MPSTVAREQAVRQVQNRLRAVDQLPAVCWIDPDDGQVTPIPDPADTWLSVAEARRRVADAADALEEAKAARAALQARLPKAEQVERDSKAEPSTARATLTPPVH